RKLRGHAAGQGAAQEGGEMKKLLFAILLAAGSAQAADAKLAKDDFDGATRVWVDPHGLDCGMTMVCPLLGARWTSKLPDEAVLEVQVINAYAAIRTVKLNIDGEFIDLQATDPADATRFSNNVDQLAGLPSRVPVT